MTPPRYLPRNRAPEVPPDFWHTDAMIDALSSGDLGRVIRAYRFHPHHDRHLPQSLVACWLHVSQTSLSRIEQGKCRLTIDDIAGFARSLGLPWALRWVPQHEKADVESFSRRSLFGAGVGAALGLNATTAPIAAREIDPELASHWADLLLVIDRHDAAFGPHDLLSTVCRELGLISEHRQVARGALRTDLLRIEARWSEFASWLAHDAGDERIADYWADRALRLAYESEYPDMVAYVLIRRSHSAVAGLDARQAITFANAAFGIDGTSDQVRALSALKAAHGHALAHDAVSCERSLADAYDLLDAGPREGASGDVLGHEVTVPYVLGADARCWLWLKPFKAIGMFEDVLHRWPRDRTRSRGVQQARLAFACVAANEPERAAAEGLKALDTAQRTRSHITRRELKQLDHRLADYDVPAVADFREAFAAL
jgi:transcriptional regulator with XRE-family HTH domain